MSEVDGIAVDRATALRQAFDQAFVDPVRTEFAETVDFIAIRLGGDAHALKMSQIAGLRRDVSVTPVPGPLPELIGVAGFRGALTPVYDLPALLDYPPVSDGRWVVLAEGGALAFAFDTFVDHFRVGREAIAIGKHDAAKHHVSEVVRFDADVLPVIDLQSVVAAIRRRLPHSLPTTE